MGESSQPPRNTQNPHQQRPFKSNPLSPFKSKPSFQGHLQSTNPQSPNTNTNDLINHSFASTTSTKPKYHQRSHSHSNYSNQQQPQWQQLIPPMPADQIQNLNFDFSLNDREVSPSNKSNRHSMPGSPMNASPHYLPNGDFANSPFFTTKPQPQQQQPQPQQKQPQPTQPTQPMQPTQPTQPTQPATAAAVAATKSNTSMYPYHQSNKFSVKKNDMPPQLKHQLDNNPPKFKRSGSTNQPSSSSNTSVNSQSRLEAPFQVKKGDSNSKNASIDNVTAPNNTSANTQSKVTNELSQNKSVRKRRKTCKTCGKEITGQFVRALNSSFHVDCFCCNECGKQCSSKFFPFEVVDKNTNMKYQVALCEYDYFKKLNLICFNCNSALRGPYITAIGNKYHLEHFKCTICQKVFDSDESYYEHDANIYCHYHYSKLFANHCEGCHSAIVKQFVELYRGGRNQQWHPECYMVHKFWNVTVKQDFVDSKSLLVSSDKEAKYANDLPFNKEEEQHLKEIEESIENLVIKCWLTLSGYEELTASSISDMLLNACIGNQFNGLISTGKLIILIEILFNAIDYLINLDKFDLKKEARNLSGKIMSYLAVLRKSNQINDSGSLSSELLSVITGCAHYLKLLIRIGLQNALKMNKSRSDTVATDNFLAIIKAFEKFQPPSSNGSNSSFNDDAYIKLIQDSLHIPLQSTDLCFSCHKSIERSCIKFNDKRWHIKCFKCSTCSSELNNLNMVNFDVNNNELLCLDCAGGQTDRTKGFEFITDLGQLSYLLKIAFLRSKQVMALDYKNSKSDANNGSNVANSENNGSGKDLKKLNYSDTLNDITRLRTKRQSQKLSNSVKKNARKSMIIDAPQAENVEADNTRNDSTISEDLMDHNPSATSSNKSFVISQDDNDLFVHKQNQESKDAGLNSRLVIKDEPVSLMASGNNHLNRTSDLLKNEKSLTLDDIPRIVAAEQARDQRPNAFKHHNSLYQRQKPIERFVPNNSNNMAAGAKPGHNMESGFNPNAGINQNANGVNGNVNGADAGSGAATRHLKYYSELDKSEHFILRHIAIEAFHQLLQQKVNKLDLLPLIQTRKSPSFWDKLKFGGNSHNSNNQNPGNKEGVFGVDLQELTKKYGIDSDLGVGPSKLRIPIVIDDIINSLKTKDMSVEGIFRLNGNIKKLRELTEQINGNPLKSPDFSNQTAVQLAALMKKWLRDLPNPLLTFNLYDLWIESQRQANPIIKKRLIKLIYCMLPRSHRDLVEVLLYFFNWVASFAEIDEETGSKMDIHNLATVISPNILYAKQDSDQINQSGEAYFLAIEVVNQLIETHEELSYIPNDLMEFYEKCQFTKADNISTKEIMNKIDKVSKETPNYFLNIQVQDENSDPMSQEVRSNTISRGLSKVLMDQYPESNG